MLGFVLSVALSGQNNVSADLPPIKHNSWNVTGQNGTVEPVKRRSFIRKLGVMAALAPVLPGVAGAAVTGVPELVEVLPRLPNGLPNPAWETAEYEMHFEVWSPSGTLPFPIHEPSRWTAIVESGQFPTEV